MLYFSKLLCHNDHDNTGYSAIQSLRTFDLVAQIAIKAAPTARASKPLNAGFSMRIALYCLPPVSGLMNVFKSFIDKLFGSCRQIDFSFIQNGSV